MKKLLSVVTMVACGWAFAAGAADTGDQVIIIYNKKVSESKDVAKYYAQRRNVPSAQIFGFALSTNEGMSRAEFRYELQRPLAEALKKKKLWQIGPEIIHATTNKPGRVDWKVAETKIRYAVLCYGVPLRIEHDPNFREEGMEKVRAELRRDEAAVDSELALLPLIESMPPLAGPLHSGLYTTTNRGMLHPTNGVLMVTRLDGPTAAIARGLVDKALEAEANGLWGRAYFDLRNATDPGYKMGDEWIRNAANIGRRLGFETVVDENPTTFPTAFPMSQIAFYIGWYDGTVSGPLARPVVEFMPGAFAYHLHSFSASTVRSPSQNWVGPFLAKGATITMGSVAEPYISGTPDVGVFTARLVFQGFTFGEAAYAAQATLSWQTTVVGDPLYQPFAKDADRLHRELEARGSKLAAWSWLRLANLHLAAGRPAVDVVTLLEQVANAKPSAVLSEKLGDLYAAQGKPSSAIHAYARALDLDPSRQQRVRLLLTLAEKRLAADATPEAYGDYQRLLREFPDYPDPLALYRKLLPLAQKLGETADAEKYQAEIQRLTPPPPPPPPSPTNTQPAAGGVTNRTAGGTR